MDAGRCHQPRIVAAELECPLRGSPRFSNHHHAADASSPGPVQHLGAVRIVGGIGEVAVRVDEHGRQDGKVGKEGKDGKDA
jgi:hypothetical protein